MCLNCQTINFWCDCCGVVVGGNEGHWVLAEVLDGSYSYPLYCARCALDAADFGPHAEAWQDAIQDVLKREKRGLTISLDTIETTLGQRN
jgi:hypothetical protein